MPLTKGMWNSQAREFARRIRDLQLTYGDERIAIIAHSAGGRLAISSCEELAKLFGDSKIELLLTLGTPGPQKSKGIRRIIDFTSWSDPLSFWLDKLFFSENVERLPKERWVAHVDWHSKSPQVDKLIHLLTSVEVTES